MPNGTPRFGPGSGSFLCPRTIGRTVELAALREWLATPTDGAVVLLIAGEAGAGKSRLAAEARTIAADLGYGTLVAACFEADRSLPFAPARDLLRALVDERGSTEVGRLAGTAIADLALLLPRLRELPGAAARVAGPDPAEERYRLFDALTRLLRALSADAPLLIAVEDLHWSDDTGLDLLLHLARRAADERLLFLFTYRDDEVHPALAHVLAALDRERLATELRLARLGPAEVDGMLRAILCLDGPVPADLLHLVYTLTEGNPFFVEEVLKALSLSGDPRAAAGAWNRVLADRLLVPRSVQDAVGRRLDLLGANARRVAMLAAVAGRRFDFDLLLELSGGDEAALLDAIRELIAAQLVGEEGPDRFAFRHALTSQAIAAGLLDRERRALHRRVAEALERRAGIAADTATTELALDALPDAPVDDLADHFARAGVWERALLYARLSGQRAQAIDAPHAAAEHFTRALDATSRLGRSPDPGLLRARGAAYETLGEFERARVDYEGARDLAHAGGDWVGEVDSLLALGLLWSGRDYDRAGEPIRAALALAREVGDPALIARCLNRVGNWHFNREQLREGQRFHREALAIVEGLDDRRGIAETLDLLGLAAYFGGDLVQGTAHLVRAVDVWRELGDRRGLASSLIVLAMRSPTYHTDTVPAVADHAAALAVVEEALANTRAIGWRAGESWALWILGGMNLAAQGAYGRAFEAMEAALGIAEEIEHRQWLAAINCMLGNACADLLAFSRARQHLELAREFARETGSPYWTRSAAAWLASVAVAQGDLVGAATVLDDTLDSGLAMETLAQRLLWRSATELALARGEPAQALQIVDRLVATAPNASTGRPTARLEKLRGDALAALGDVAAAGAALRRARDTAAERGTRPVLWRCHLALGWLYQGQGRDGEATDAFAAARALVEDLAAEVPEEAVREGFLTEAATRFPGAPRRTPRQAAKEAFGGLTEREREIAALLVAGRTNRDIGEALSVSEWTVATHVRNILAKLDLRSRTQVAAWAVAHGLASDDETAPV